MSKYYLTISNRLPITTLIEKYYSFIPEELFLLAKRKSNFDYISFNHEINWTPELIEKLEKGLDWSVFSVNKSVPWETITPKYESFISWKEVSDNPAFIWKDEYLKKHSDEIDWSDVSRSNAKFTEENLFQFRKFWDWEGLSDNQNIPWSEELLDGFATLLNWSTLSGNPALPFTKQLINKFRDSWNFRLMSSNPKLVSDKFLPLLKSFTSLDYELVSFYKEDFTIVFIEKYADKLDWLELSENEHLPWSEEFFNHFSDRWHFIEMSGNTKIPWSIELIEKYKNEWNWKGEKYGKDGWNLSLSSNEGLPWSFGFIEKYNHKLEWGHLVHNPIEDFYEVIDGITCLRKLNWTVEKMAKYASHLHEYFFLNNKNFYTAIENEIGKENIFQLYNEIGFS